jgi:SnoaL-like domain
MYMECVMSLTVDDRLEIHEVIALHGHLCDAGAYGRFDEVFTPDLEVDASDLGLAPLPPADPSRPRLEMYIAAAHRIGPGGTLALHVTNVMVREDGDGARAWSKGLAVNQDGSAASFPTRISSCERVRAGASGTGRSQLVVRLVVGPSHSFCPTELLISVLPDFLLRHRRRRRLMSCVIIG